MPTTGCIGKVKQALQNNLASQFNRHILTLNSFLCDSLHVTPSTRLPSTQLISQVSLQHRRFTVEKCDQGAGHCKLSTQLVGLAFPASRS